MAFSKNDKKNKSKKQFQKTYLNRFRKTTFKIKFRKITELFKNRRFHIIILLLGAFRAYELSVLRPPVRQGEAAALLTWQCLKGVFLVKR